MTPPSTSLLSRSSESSRATWDPRLERAPDASQGYAAFAPTYPRDGSGLGCHASLRRRT